ncbi:histidine triad (HIT) family protein [Actinokineospora baliensis]|uniref:histidine triad nucleotide-binding protein n=1 Tax=Actinokineospora baliensis TaxID=547056 RepID=UPI001958619B|nr:histidine triad nucleotide-binding protein [Actinokineospora baliensis]MBM7772554.1 histidine triad (HIT) family protein [Actinokineospora baliensis]
MSGCLFCGIIGGEIPSTVVYEDDRVYAFRDINPQAKVHVLVVPREHHEDVEALSANPTLLAAVITAGVEVAKREGIHDSGYRFVFNTGDDACRTVFHAHLHVLGAQQLSTFGH